MICSRCGNLEHQNNADQTQGLCLKCHNDDQMFAELPLGSGPDVDIVEEGPLCANPACRKPLDPACDGFGQYCYGCVGDGSAEDHAETLDTQFVTGYFAPHP
jgi:hypothetical protein